ncbi:hypothetical protein GCM10020256_51860 [Streptomyces thermocoprophilus]
MGHALRWLLLGIGRGLAALGTWTYAAVARLVRYLIVVPALWLYTWVLAPTGRALLWCARAAALVVEAVVAGIGAALYRTGRVLFVLPALAVWRYVLVPVGRFVAVVAREIGDALGHAWRIAGYVSQAVGRFLGTLFRWIFVEPVRWVYRSVLTPVGHAVRDAVLRPAAQAARSVGRGVRQALAAARDTGRRTRAELRRALFGAPRRAYEADRREPVGRDTRTLGSSTTALTKD